MIIHHNNIRRSAKCISTYTCTGTCAFTVSPKFREMKILVTLELLGSVPLWLSIHVTYDSQSALACCHLGQEPITLHLTKSRIRTFQLQRPTFRLLSHHTRNRQFRVTNLSFLCSFLFRRTPLGCGGIFFSVCWQDPSCAMCPTGLLHDNLSDKQQRYAIPPNPIRYQLKSFSLSKLWNSYRIIIRIDMVADNAIASIILLFRFQFVHRITFLSHPRCIGCDCHGRWIYCLVLPSLWPGCFCYDSCRRRVSDATA